MASSPTTIPYVPIRDFIDKWGWSEKIVREFIASGGIKPSFAIGDRPSDYVYFETYDPGFGPPAQRTVPLSSFGSMEAQVGVDNSGGVVSYTSKLFLQRPKPTGHNDCEFTLATFEPDPPLEVYDEYWNYDLSWVEVTKPIKLSEVVENGFFSDLEIQRFGGLDKLLGLVPVGSPTATAAQGGAPAGPSINVLTNIVYQVKAEPVSKYHIADDALTKERLQTTQGIEFLQSIYGTRQLTPGQRATAIRNLMAIYGTRKKVAEIVDRSPQGVKKVLDLAELREAKLAQATKNAGKTTKR